MQLKMHMLIIAILHKNRLQNSKTGLMRKGMDIYEQRTGNGKSLPARHWMIKKALDIKVIDIHEVSVIADYFVIASGSNLNQVQAMVDNVEEQLGRAGL